MNNAEGRLEKLEKGLRKTRRLALVALVLAAGLITASLVAATGAGEVAEVKAKRFVLTDDAGRVRGGLALMEADPVLTLLDENGQARVTLAVAKEGAGLLLADENGQARVTLAAVEDGPVLKLYDENGKVRAGLGVVEAGPALEFTDAAGRVEWHAP